MAKFKVINIEERTDGKIACDTFVFAGEGENERTIGHFTVILDADEVNEISGTKKERVAAYKALFFADPRIARTVDSELAVAKMEADISFPIEVEL